MFIDSSKAVLGGKTYTRHLLRDSYRDKASGKVRHHTIANLSHYPEEEIEAIKLALKHKDNLASLGSIKDLKTRLGMRIGVVYTLKTVAERVGLTKALGPTREGKLALWQVMARLIGQGSRLRAVRLAESHAASDVLGLEDFNEDDLYANLSWLSERQEAIEQRLFRQRYGGNRPQLFLYDVTSSYLEGVQNILAAFGYNRDGKKGKMQLVIGLLEGPSLRRITKIYLLLVAHSRTRFRHLYQILLGADSGPRLGAFIYLYGIDATIGRLETYLRSVKCI